MTDFCSCAQCTGNLDPCYYICDICGTYYEQCYDVYCTSAICTCEPHTMHEGYEGQTWPVLNDENPQEARTDSGGEN